MQLCDFLAQMEAIAPQALAMDFDNPGLLIGPEKQEIRKVLVALDCSMATAQEAVDWGADLLLTHHPVFFGGVKAIRPDLPATAAPWLLLWAFSWPCPCWPLPPPWRWRAERSRYGPL